MSKEDALDKLIRRLEAGYITRTEFDVLKADLVATKKGNATMNIEVGQDFREYFVESKIGEGGMGSAFKVRHRNDSIFRAQGYRVLKIIKPDLAGNDGFRKRFVEEAAKGITLHHPRVAKVYDLFDTEQMLGILMEYIDGEELSLVRTLDVEQVLGLLHPICETLDFIHGQGIVHRDIKPENIRLHPERGPVLLDFGIAKDISLDLTQSTVMMGTPLYMAPEQLDAARVTGAADQYAVSMMAYHWFSGQFPWAKNASRSRIDLAKLMGKLLPLCDVKPTIPSGVSDVLMRGLSINPQERYSSCMDLYRALEEVSGVSGASSPQESLSQTRIVPEPAPTEVVSSSSSTRVVSERPNQTRVLSNEGSSTRVVNEGAQTRVLSNTRVMESQPKMESSPKVDSSSANEDSSSSKGGMWKWAVGGLVLCVGGYVGFDIIQQSGLQSRVDSISSDAARFGFEVPSGQLSESVVEELENKVGTRRQEVAAVQSLYNGKEIPSGSFTMGCTSEQGSDCDSDERPTHKVTISRGFVLMESEVTQELYQKVMSGNPSRFKGSNRPVERVSWFDAVNMANKLSVLEGLDKCYSIDGKEVTWSNDDCTGWRLPTEAEWEYAARGGKYSHKYSGSNNVDKVAWLTGNSSNKTQNVCEKTRNGYGLCDMSGNVYEWVWDWKGAYSSSPSVDPRGPTSGSYRVGRGGSWVDYARNVRVASRSYFVPSFTYSYLGFRLARTSP